MWYNRIMIWLLRSPLHRLLSGSFMVITVKGRKSGRSISLPVNYIRDGYRLMVLSQSDRTWWRNLRGNATVRLHLQGKEVSGQGEVAETAEQVQMGLRSYLQKMPQAARFMNISMHPDGQPDLQALQKAAQGRVIITVSLDKPG